MKLRLPKRRQANRGSVLVGAMIGIAIIAVAASGLLLSSGNAFYAVKSIKMSQSSKEIDDFIKGSFAALLRADSCVTAPATTFANIPIAQYGRMQFANNINLANIADAQTKPGFSLWHSAAERCARPGQSGSSKFYFCMQFHPSSSSAVKGSFLDSDVAFMEALVESRNFHQGQTIPCQTANASPGNSGSRVFYTLYWAANSPSGVVLKNLTSVLYLGK